MAKTTRTYWNPLSDEHRNDWQPIKGLEGIAEELTLAIARSRIPARPKALVQYSGYQHQE